MEPAFIRSADRNPVLILPASSVVILALVIEASAIAAESI